MLMFIIGWNSIHRVRVSDAARFECSICIQGCFLLSQRIVRVNIGGGSAKVLVVKNAAIVDKLVWVGSNYMQA